MKRATILESSAKSEMNVFTPTSDLSETHPISMDHNRRLITEIIDEIFNARKGNVELSSSQCSSAKLSLSEYSCDKRLQYWKDVLDERQRLGRKIQEVTDKKSADILFNRQSTLDDRNKRTVQRVIDYAQRMEPVRLLNVQAQRLKEKCTRETYLPIFEVEETLPKAERDKSTAVEISGLPDVIKTELLGARRHRGEEKPYSWLKCPVVGNRIEEIAEDIERVVEFYPDIDNLQIVGTSMIPDNLTRRSSDIKLISKLDITEISTESTSICGKEELAESLEKAEPVEFGLRVNDNVFLMTSKRSAKNINIDVSFAAQPFQRKIKPALTIKNIGQKVLNFEWAHRSYYDKSSALLKPLDNEFLFDRAPFRLYGGELKEISVMYQPRRVDVVKAKWILKVEPQFFCRKVDGIILKLSGICCAPPEYEKKIADIMYSVVHKSNMQMMRDLTINLSNLVPLIKPPEIVCPYQRILNEIELFEQLNPGYKCERYHDIELLRDLYERVRKRRQCPWNLKIDSLKCAILKLSDANERAIHLDELNSIIEPMKGECIELDTRILENSEMERSKLLFVRGSICSSIDEWEDLTITLEETFLKTYLVKFKEEVEAYYNEEGYYNEEAEEEDENAPKYPPLDDEEKVREYVLDKRIKHSQSFRDCLYMQTYTLVGDSVEKLVIIMESSDTF